MLTLSVRYLVKRLLKLDEKSAGMEPGIFKLRCIAVYLCVLITINESKIHQILNSLTPIVCALSI